MTVYVLRHGETAWSRDRRHTGRTDVPLLGEGRTLAAEAGRLLVRLRGQAPWALVLTSPLARARETATLAGFPDAQSDERLREWDYGDHEGRTTEEIQMDSPAWWLWSDGAVGGEDAAAVGARVDRLLEERVRPQTGDVLLVAHSHLLRVLTARWLGLPPAAGAMIVLDPAGIGVLGTEHERPALLRWNLSPAVAGG